MLWAKYSSLWDPLGSSTRLLEDGPARHGGSLAALRQAREAGTASLEQLRIELSGGMCVPGGPWYMQLDYSSTYNPKNNLTKST